ncbi:hypothetical protein SETIT_5G116300v2 [Setaria italica]|uniref:Leucine-rich repeat-containing N-terminal plant-type domain-containing protein n=1 Tax=Setaria italica TaxID=4555 RepID=A0A368R3T7_SETIT|nr:hypothetical protein SETIT_5G116300v2 [Setaria italica]
MYTPNLRVLRLPFCDVPGPIFRALSALHSLSVIDLQFNRMMSPFPNFVANFSFLSVLQLSHNDLEGFVSPKIFEHDRLVTIDLHSTYEISGSLPNFSGHSCLQNLLVGDTGFSGTIPSSIGKVKSSKSLGLDAPGFFGNMPSSIGELKSLNTSKVSGLNLVRPIPSLITNLTSLEVLRFSECGLHGPIPSSTDHLIKLKSFAVMQCKGSGGIHPHIYNMTQLEELVLPLNNFTGTVELNSLWRLPNLFHLDLSNNKIVVLEGQDNSSMVFFPNIIYLNLASCSITKFPSILKRLNDWNGLDLSNNQMHGAIPRWAWEKWSTGPDFGHFYLNLSHNKFTSVGYDTFLPFYSVILDLSFNMFEGSIPIPQYSAVVLDYSGNMFSPMPHNFSTQLEDAYIFKASRNNLSGNIPISFCVNLEFLDLSHNTFSGSIPSCLMEDANSLTVLNLKENQLDGELPHNNMNKSCTLQLLDISTLNKEWLSTLMGMMVIVNNQTSAMLEQERHQNQVYQVTTELTYKGSELTFDKILRTLGFLDVSHNALQGSIPEAIGEPVLLEVLNMSFTGPIPSNELSHLAHLEALDLSSNELSGAIPLELASLDSLTTLNLSNNKLTGSIPESPHFSTFSNSSFLGNDGLCGPPWSKECINDATTPNVASNHSKKKYGDIVLFLFDGLGFGVGFAIAIVWRW